MRNIDNVTKDDRTPYEVVVEALERRLATVTVMITALQKERLWLLTKITEMKKKADKFRNPT